MSFMNSTLSSFARRLKIFSHKVLYQIGMQSMHENPFSFFIGFAIHLFIKGLLLLHKKMEGKSPP